MDMQILLYQPTLLHHTPEVNDFVKGLNELISDEGVIIIEIHYLGFND